MSKLEDALRRIRGEQQAIQVPQVDDACEHVAPLEPVVPAGKGCQKCQELGDTWVHLRLCMSCGHVGCCDNSKNKHATKHFHESDHPVIKSFEPGEHWLWCYVDAEFMI